MSNNLPVSAAERVNREESPPLHTVVRVYNNGDSVTTTFDSAWDMKKHLDFSVNARFGCAHFANGKCISLGYLSAERCKEIEVELQKAEHAE